MIKLVISNNIVIHLFISLTEAIATLFKKVYQKDINASNAYKIPLQKKYNSHCVY